MKATEAITEEDRHHEERHGPSLQPVLATAAPEPARKRWAQEAWFGPVPRAHDHRGRCASLRCCQACTETERHSHPTLSGENGRRPNAAYNRVGNVHLRTDLRSASHVELTGMVKTAGLQPVGGMSAADGSIGDKEAD